MYRAKRECAGHHEYFRPFLASLDVYKYEKSNQKGIMNCYYLNSELFLKHTGKTSFARHVQ